MENKEHPEVSFGKTGVLLINLGTPDSYKWWDIRNYLKEFRDTDPDIGGEPPPNASYGPSPLAETVLISKESEIEILAIRN